jgi:hypothetical protein
VANSCTNFRTNLALQTPVYDKMFLREFKPMDSPLIGRHETEAWEDGTGDTHYFDRVTVGQPDLTKAWGRIDASECGTNSCNPPRSFVSFGTQRDSYYKEQIVLQSQLFCLTQLRHQTRPGEQITEIYRNIKQVPEMFTTEFLRNRAFQYAPTVQIATASGDTTFTPAASTVEANLTVINLTASGLPTSQLTWNYLNYLTTQLQLQGYQTESGLPMGLYNLITDPRSWFKLSNGSADIKEMMALSSSDQASPLYRIAVDGGIQKPFGNIAPTLDKLPARFQVLSGSILNRVYPYYNATNTTGTKRVVNPAYVNARYQLSYIWHPKAIKLWTAAFKKIHEKVPSVNSSLYGTWTFVNNQGVMSFTQPDGTVCTLNNDLQNYFYWLVAMELGFQYKYPELIMPILHLVDGSGKDSIAIDPVCGTAPQYVAQNYSSAPTEC